MWVVVCVLIIVFLGYGLWVEPRNIRLCTVRVVVPVLSRGVNLIVISDTHAKCESLKKVYDLVAPLCASGSVEAILWPGDLHDRHADSKADDWYQKYSELGVPMYGVQGNNDAMFCKLEPAEQIQRLSNLGLQMIDGEIRYICKDGVPVLNLLGVKELERGNDYRAHTFMPLDSSREAARRVGIPTHLHHDTALPVIWLAHNPDAVYAASRIRPDVVISGHTHGGQVFLFAWLMPLLKRYVPALFPCSSFALWAGVKKVEGSWVVVSRGIAGGFRVGRPPEVLIVELRCE